MGKIIDLSGKSFGGLIVIKRVKNYVSPKGQHQTQWICKCRCGNTITVSSSNLKKGNTTSCGCYKSEQLSKKFKDIVGQKFGKLTALRRASDNVQPSFQHKSMFVCLCDCGREIVTAAYRLRNGETQSCGCIRESIISTDLKHYFKIKYNAIIEHKIFRNPETNSYLPYDIYLPKENIFIEVHGQQHYKFDSYFHKTMDRFNSSKHRDRLKRNFARKNGIYIEIDLRKTETTKEAINIIEKIINEQ